MILSKNRLHHTKPLMKPGAAEQGGRGAMPPPPHFSAKLYSFLPINALITEITALATPLLILLRRPWKQLNILSIYDINIHKHLVFMYKYKNNNLPVIFSEYFSSASNTRYNLRSLNLSNYNVKYFQKKKSDFCISSRGPKIWNTLHESSIKEAKTISSFKYLAKRNLFLKYV